MRRTLAAAVLLTLALPGAASAHAKPKTVHCESGYAREARKVKERRHGMTTERSGETPGGDKP